VNGPDVRWEGVSHEQIVAWTRDGRGAAVTETLESRLTSAADALSHTADLINTTLQRVNGGEWTGDAATVVAGAMQVLRDFDDLMGHHSTVNTLAAYGQSDNASWVKATVPPVVDVHPMQIPTGNPADVLSVTEDHHHQLEAARDARTRARQVMRDYEAMTTDRVAALPPLPPAPQVVVAGDDTITIAGPRPAIDSPRPRSGAPDSGGQGSAGPGNGDSGSGGPGKGGPDTGGHDGGASGGTGRANPGDGSSAGSAHPGGDGSGMTPRPGSSLPLPAPTETSGTVPAGTTPPPALPGTSEPPSGGHPSDDGTPRGSRETTPVGRGPVGEHRGGSGFTPFGPAGPTRAEDDKDHQVKYGVPGSAIFEPDHDDGLLHDPFRPGSYVAPASIGDDEDA
jgi:hypothetical protein